MASRYGRSAGNRERGEKQFRSYQQIDIEIFHIVSFVAGNLSSPANNFASLDCYTIKGVDTDALKCEVSC